MPAPRRYSFTKIWENSSGVTPANSAARRRSGSNSLGISGAAQHATLERVPQSKMQDASFGRDAMKFKFVEWQCLQQCKKVSFFLNGQKIRFESQPFRNFA